MGQQREGPDVARRGGALAQHTTLLLACCIRNLSCLLPHAAHSSSVNLSPSLHLLPAFRAKERTAATRGMPLTERAAYRIGAVVAGSRTARSALMAYALVLHCVIFLVLARWAAAAASGSA